MSGDHLTWLGNSGDGATENCTVEDGTKKSKKRKKNLNAMTEDDCHITTLERFYKRDLLCLSRPSYLLGLGSNNVRPENRSRLCELLRKLMRRHNWIEASGVLSVLLKGTCKDTCPTTNRFKYLASMELLKHEQSDPVNAMAISGLYDTWMSRIGINLANKRRRVECTKEDKLIVRLESILFNLMQGNVEGERQNARSLIQDHEFESHPVFNIIIGLIFWQLWYSSIPEDLQWKDTDQICSPAHSETSDTHSPSQMSRFSCKFEHSKWHNGILSDESYTSFQHNSETSVMNDKKDSVVANYDLHREGVPMEVGIKKENLQQDFHTQGFFTNSAENESSVDNNAGYIPSFVNLSAFKKLDSWMLPIRIGNWELDRAIQDNEYKNAVKYLRSAVHSNPPRLEALLPLTQLLLLGCRDKEALNELEEFSANSGAVLPRRLRANILERFDPNNSPVLSTCFEDILKIDPTCRESLAKLISQHQDGNYRPESLLEMAALHLDAVFAECNVWREFASSFLKVHQYEEGRLSVCLHAKEGGQLPRYSSVRYNSIPKSFTHGKLRRAWAFRCKWWLTRHFSRSILASEIAAGDLELLTYKAACASHMYGQESEYVVGVYNFLEKENNMDLLAFLRRHRQNSIGLYPYLQQRTS